MMGLDRVMLGPRMVRVDSSSGDAATEGPLGDDVRDRCMAGIDRDATWARAAARCDWCIWSVSNERRDVKVGFESTRWKSCFSSTLDRPLSVAESSQSDESSSSSSIALSETSSSSSLSNTSSSPTPPSTIVLASTSSLKEVCFRFRPSDNELRDARCEIRSSKELSSSPDDPPSKNIPPFFFD